jgi:katanin p80 WD40 repeat-containing subunit B1
VVQYNPFGKLLASGSLDCNVKVWDIRAKACVQTMKGHTTGVVKLAISPDSRWLASGSENGELKVRPLLQQLTGRQRAAAVFE